MTAVLDEEATAEEPRAEEHEAPSHRAAWWRYAMLAIGAIIFLFPFYYMIVGSFATTQRRLAEGSDPRRAGLTLHNYTASMTRSTCPARC